MKTILSPIAILALRGFSREDKQRLADYLGVGIATIHHHIRNESDVFTKAGCMEIIREVTGQTDDVLLVQVGSESKVA